MRARGLINQAALSLWLECTWQTSLRVLYVMKCNITRAKSYLVVFIIAVTFLQDSLLIVFMEVLDYIIVEEWKYVMMECGVLCLTINGMIVPLLWYADS